MRKFLMLANIYQLNDTIVDETIAIRKIVKLKIPDAIIGATALANNLTLITRNLADFKRIERLNVINPHGF